jgi:2-polyprenyl-3-methyl-5-hydroxy-6-metoxy-1,4-benzoquinol methylase
MTACRVCMSSGEHRRHRVPEMMIGTGEAFDYVECADCGCLQIAEIPEDMSPHYPPEYYAFESEEREAPRRGLRSRLERHWLRHAIGWRDPVGRVLSIRWRTPPPWTGWLGQTGARPGTRVLDVGCGSGRLLRLFAWLGFSDLTGIDPYAPDGADPSRIHRCEIADHEGEYDLVMLHHVLEHVRDPLATLTEARRLAGPTGRVLVRTPVTGGEAWERYGVHWVQIDAPRHLHIHTQRSLATLAARADLEVESVRFDSTTFQFWGSEQARRGVPLMSTASHAISPVSSAFSVDSLATWTAESESLNLAGRGDAAAFYLVPTGQLEGIVR